MNYCLILIVAPLDKSKPHLALPGYSPEIFVLRKKSILPKFPKLPLQHRE